MAESRDVTATSEKSGGNAALKGIKAVAKFCLDNWLVFGFGIATLLAYFFPSQSSFFPCVKSPYCQR